MTITPLSKNFFRMTGGFTTKDCAPFVTVVGQSSLEQAFLMSSAHPKKYFVLAQSADFREWLLEIQSDNVSEYFYADDERLEVEAGAVFLSNIEAKGVQEIL